MGSFRDEAATKSSSRRLHADAWSLVEAPFSVAKDHIHPGQTDFRRRMIADERARRQPPRRRKLKTLFPLDPFAGFAQCRLTRTKN